MLMKLMAYITSSELEKFFAWLPIETMIYENQQAYYAALNESNRAGESTLFVTFMLCMIRDILKELVANQNAHRSIAKNVGINVGINLDDMSMEQKVLILLKDNPKITAKQLSVTLKLSVRQIERIIASLKKADKIERIGARKNGSWKVL